MLLSRRGFHAFTEYDLRTSLEQSVAQLRKQIEADDSLANIDEEEYIKQKVAQKTLKGIEFDPTNITLSHREEQIPAEYFGSGFMVDRGHSYPKQVVTFHLPFTGDEDLLHCQPSSMLMTSDEVAVSQGHVIFDVINFSNDADQVAKARDEVVGHLVQKAGFLNKDIEAHNGRLEVSIREAVRSAKIKNKDQSDFLSKLGNKPKNG